MEKKDSTTRYHKPILKITFDFPDLAAETNDGTSNLSPGPKMLLGRMQQVRSPLEPFELITRSSPSAFVAEYESLC